MATSSLTRANNGSCSWGASIPCSQTAVAGGELLERSEQCLWGTVQVAWCLFPCLLRSGLCAGFYVSLLVQSLLQLLAPELGSLGLSNKELQLVVCKRLLVGVEGCERGQSCWLSRQLSPLL